MDIVVYSCQINIHSPPAVERFLANKQTIDNRFQEKPYLFVLEILPATAANNPVEPDIVYRLLESVIVGIKNGVQVIKFGRPDSHKKKFSAQASGEELLLRLITDIIHEIGPSVLIVTDSYQILNDKAIIAAVNQFLQRNKKI